GRARAGQRPLGGAARPLRALQRRAVLRGRRGVRGRDRAAATGPPPARRAQRSRPQVRGRELPVGGRAGEVPAFDPGGQRLGCRPGARARAGGAMRRLLLGGLMVLLAGVAGADDDVAAARAVFQRNLDAIAHRDKDAYLACYLNAGTLARTGFDGPALGFDSFAKAAGEQWPDTFEARDLRLVPVRPGVVY